MTLGDVLFLFVIFLASFVPTVAALIWLRWGERGRKERWEDLLRTFLFGAVVAAVIATVLELVATTILFNPVVREYEYFAQDPTLLTFIAIILIAPVIEEYVKALGVKSFSRYIWRPRNGLLFGAAAGLGFAATENFLYESTAYFEEGFRAFVVVALVRSLSSTLMHASATSISGYGVARAKTYGGPWWPYLVVAVVMHALFNLFASFGLLFADRFGPAAETTGLVFSIVLVIVAVLFIRWRLHGYHA